MRPERAVHPLCSSLCFSFFFSSLFSISSPLFSLFLLLQLSHLLLFFFFHSVFLLCPYLFSSFLFSLSHSFFFFFFLNSFHPFSSSPLFHFPLSCLLLILSFSFVPSLFFFFEGTACTECFSRCNRGHH